MTIYWHVGGPKRSIFRSVILAGSSFSPKIRVMRSGSADVGGRRVVGCNFQGNPTFLTGRRRHHKPRAERAVGVHAPVASLPKYCLNMWRQSDLNIGICCILIAFLNVSTICSTSSSNLRCGVTAGTPAFVLVLYGRCCACACIDYSARCSKNRRTPV